ncbi:MAG: hypothetical protein R3F56_16420 [Planctomycetota bacterium]
MPRGTRLDATSVLLLASVGLFAWTIRTPYAEAIGTAAIETDTLRVARILFEAAEAHAGTLEGDGDAATFVAELDERLQAAALPAQARPRREASVLAAGLVLVNDTHCFLVTRTPPAPDALEPPLAQPAEVWAWPRAADQAASTVFCVTPGGTVATRNITERYVGADRPPEPGTWRPAKPGERFTYKAYDGGYWRRQPD